MKRVTKPAQTQPWTLSSLFAWESWCYRVRLWIWWQKLDIHILHTWFFITTFSTKFLVNNITGPSSRPGWLSVASWHSPVVTSNDVEACSFGNNKEIVFAKLRPIVNRCDSTPTKITSWDSWQRTGPTHSFFFRKESSLSSWPSSPARCTQQCPEMLTNSQREEPALTHKYSNNVTGRYRKVFMPSCLPSSSTGVWACWIFFLPPQQKIHRAHWKIRVVQGQKCWGNANFCWSRMTSGFRNSSNFFQQTVSVSVSKWLVQQRSGDPKHPQLSALAFWWCSVRTSSPPRLSTWWVETRMLKSSAAWPTLSLACL